jgi:hypothetical protein
MSAAEKCTVKKLSKRRACVSSSTPGSYAGSDGLGPRDLALLSKLNCTRCLFGMFLNAELLRSEKFSCVTRAHVGCQLYALRFAHL